jgi:uncharacterized membrane protein YhhN
MACYWVVLEDMTTAATTARLSGATRAAPTAAPMACYWVVLEDMTTAATTVALTVASLGTTTA